VARGTDDPEALRLLREATTNPDGVNKGVDNINSQRSGGTSKDYTLDRKSNTAEIKSDNITLENKRGTSKDYTLDRKSNTAEIKTDNVSLENKRGTSKDYTLDRLARALPENLNALPDAPCTSCTNLHITPPFMKKGAVSARCIRVNDPLPAPATESVKTPRT